MKLATFALCARRTPIMRAVLFLMSRWMSLFAAVVLQ
jgi:hypothetical protein